MEEILLSFVIGEAGEIVVDDDTLPESLMDRPVEDIVEMWFADESQGEAIFGVEIMVEDELDVC